MRRLLPAILGCIAGCSSPRVELDPVPPPPVRPHESGDPESPFVAAPGDREPGTGPELQSILVDATVSRLPPGGGEPIVVELHGGPTPRRTRTEVRPDLRPFDPSAVEGEAHYLDLWSPSPAGPEVVRVGCTVTGLPEDVLFVELDTEDSGLTWADGSSGSVEGLLSDRRLDRHRSLFVRTSVPPADPRIRSLRLALDVHRAVLWDHTEVVLTEGDGFDLDLGSRRRRWVLSKDRVLTEFCHNRLFEKDPVGRAGALLEGTRIRVTDADGNPLRESGGLGTGSGTIKSWKLESERLLVLVTVDAPVETVSTRVEFFMEDLRPAR